MYRTCHGGKVRAGLCADLLAQWWRIPLNWCKFQCTGERAIWVDSGAGHDEGRNKGCADAPLGADIDPLCDTCPCGIPRRTGCRCQSRRPERTRTRYSDHAKHQGRGP